jgi:glycosyltransferase involved in cell wall biosynthesis
MKVALVHDWLTGMRGGEKCLEVFCELFPDADLYTLLHVKGSVSPCIEKHPIHTAFIQQLPFARRLYRYYLPLFPRAIERLNLSAYDLVISSSHCVAKGVKTRPGTCHISYIHTPMRYIWDEYASYFGNGQGFWLSKKIMPFLVPYLRKWDARTGQSPHYLIASSAHIASRIEKYYGREAAVVHPPVDTGSFTLSEKEEGYYLMVGALSPYKRVDLAIEAFNRLGWTLKIIGTGQDEKRLRKLAGPSVELLGWRSDPEVRDAYAGCRALIFAGTEDFGIVPLEAMACGKPVIAYGKGGALETVRPLVGTDSISPTGIFFYEQTPEALIEALSNFEKYRDLFNPSQIRQHAARFGIERFKQQVHHYIEAKFQEFRDAGYVEKTR